LNVKSSCTGSGKIACTLSFGRRTKAFKLHNIDVGTLLVGSWVLLRVIEFGSRFLSSNEKTFSFPFEFQEYSQRLKPYQFWGRVQFCRLSILGFMVLCFL
jgi:hypothetical protein